MDHELLSRAPTLRQLEYAVAVADHLHFGKAADACGVSQPGLSAQLLLLERTLGVRLFERESRRVRLTPAGAELVERARHVLRTAAELVQAARSGQDPLAGTLRLGVIPTIAPYFLPRALPAVRKALPRLKLELTGDKTDRILRQLRDGRLDVLLLALPVEGDDLESRALFVDPFVLLAPKRHELAKAPPLRDVELRDREVLLLDDGHCLRNQALGVCTRAGAHESDRLRATSLSTLVQMVANGLGITLLPRIAVLAEVGRSRELVVRAFKAPAPQRTIGLVWRKTTGSTQACEALAAALKREGAAFATRAR